MFTVSCVVCVIDSDAEVVRGQIPGADIVAVPNAHAEVPEGPGFEQRTGFLFVGNFNHPPNADAVAWWKRDIAPLLAETRPRPNSLSSATTQWEQPENWPDPESPLVARWYRLCPISIKLVYRWHRFVTAPA
jgi:hypothetical protein